MLSVNTLSERGFRSEVIVSTIQRPIKREKERKKKFCDLKMCCVGPHGPSTLRGSFRMKKKERKKPMNRISARWNNML